MGPCKYFYGPNLNIAVHWQHFYAHTTSYEVHTQFIATVQSKPQLERSDTDRPNNVLCSTDAVQQHSYCINPNLFVIQLQTWTVFFVVWVELNCILNRVSCCISLVEPFAVLHQPQLMVGKTALLNSSVSSIAHSPDTLVLHWLQIYYSVTVFANHDVCRSGVQHNWALRCNLCSTVNLSMIAT